MDLSFLAPLTSFIGFLIGSWLSHSAQDEVLAGKKFFESFRRVLLVTIITLSLALALINVNALMIIAAVFTALLVCEKLVKSVRLSFLYLGLVAVSSLIFSKELALIFSVLIFVYGIIHGALERKGIIKKALMFYMPFIILLIPFIGLGETLGFAAIGLIFELRNL